MTLPPDALAAAVRQVLSSYRFQSPRMVAETLKRAAVENELIQIELILLDAPWAVSDSAGRYRRA